MSSRRCKRRQGLRYVTCLKVEFLSTDPTGCHCAGHCTDLSLAPCLITPCMWPMYFQNGWLAAVMVLLAN